MVSLLKALGRGGGKKGAALPPLVLSDSLCKALEVLSQVFGQTWHQPVVSELFRTLRNSPNPPRGHTLSLILTKLVEEASLARPGLSNRFVFSQNQIVYRSADRRYTVLVVQGEGADDLVRVVWQVSQRQVGTSYISYQVRGSTWTPVDWKVSDQCLANLDLLAKAGGEVLGFLEEYKLLPKGSPFQKALDEQVTHAAALREQATAG
jgi:hypothetical protein